jgi:hypothetical protein
MNVKEKNSGHLMFKKIWLQKFQSPDMDYHIPGDIVQISFVVYIFDNGDFNLKVRWYTA